MNREIRFLCVRVLFTKNTEVYVLVLRFFHISFPTNKIRRNRDWDRG